VTTRSPSPSMTGGRGTAGARASGRARAGVVGSRLRPRQRRSEGPATAPFVSATILCFSRGPRSSAHNLWRETGVFAYSRHIIVKPAARGSPRMVWFGRNALPGVEFGDSAILALGPSSLECHLNYFHLPWECVAPVLAGDVGTANSREVVGRRTAHWEGVSVAPGATSSVEDSQVGHHRSGNCRRLRGRIGGEFRRKRAPLGAVPPRVRPARPGVPASGVARTVRTSRNTRCCLRRPVYRAMLGSPSGGRMIEFYCNTALAIVP